MVVIKNGFFLSRSASRTFLQDDMLAVEQRYDRERRWVCWLGISVPNSAAWILRTQPSVNAISPSGIGNYSNTVENGKKKKKHPPGQFRSGIAARRSSSGLVIFASRDHQSHPQSQTPRFPVRMCSLGTETFDLLIEQNRHNAFPD